MHTPFIQLYIYICEAHTVHVSAVYRLADSIALHSCARCLQIVQLIFPDCTKVQRILASAHPADSRRQTKRFISGAPLGEQILVQSVGDSGDLPAWENKAALAENCALKDFKSREVLLRLIASSNMCASYLALLTVESFTMKGIANLHQSLSQTFRSH